jgi:type IV pilus assembly protein PilN
MIKINLVAEITPQAAARRTKKRELSLGAKQGDILLLSVLLVAFLVTGGMWYHLSSTKTRLERRQAELRVERDRLKVFIDKVDELEKKREMLQHRINIIDELKRNQHGPVRIMDEVSRALPDLVWLDTMTVKGNVVTLKGQAMDENAVANYISNLDASPFFQEPSLVDLARSGQGLYSFTLNCVFTLKPPEIKGAKEGQEKTGAAK